MFPTIVTERLLLRAFALTDAPVVQRLAGDRRVASTTLHIPHPYEAGMAEQWIATHRAQLDQGASLTLAVTRRSEGDLVGAIGLRLALSDARAELGYWIGVPLWGHGYATEAADALVRHAFVEMGLHRVHATHLARNPASGRVMQKIGMSLEGVLRQHVVKWGVFEDLVQYGILRP